MNSYCKRVILSEQTDMVTIHFLITQPQMPSKTTKRNTVKSKTIWNSNDKPIKTLHEKIDKDIILRILTSPELTDDKKNASHKYKRKISNRYVPVNYHFSKECDSFGWSYTENSLSLQNFRKGIRHALAKHTYDDIDMVNAHPVLLSQYYVKNNNSICINRTRSDTIVCLLK